MKLPSFASAMAVALLAGCTQSEVADGVTDAHSAPSSAASTGTATTGVRGLPDFSALVEKAGDAVVNVRVVGSAKQSPDDEALIEFFHRFGVPVPHGGGEGDAGIMRGTGSGFIVSPDGYILTNAHVVSQADEVTVKLTDRREFPAKVVGSDPRTDVAVIKIDAKDLPVVSIGDDRNLKTGEWVLAIGAPFGLENTATAGIVSGTSRAIGGDSIVPFIQTDVAVNPGNSGGPLFNLKGEVVGINSMIFSESGGYMGISFAIPIDVAMDVREQLVKTGHVTRGRIGVVVQDVDAALASSFHLDRPRGALVSGVEDDGPADKAGVKTGDVILEVGDTPIEQSTDLPGLIAHIKPGTDTKLTVWRDGKERELTVRAEKLQDAEQASADAKPANKEVEGKLGLVVRPLTPEEKQSVDTQGNVVVAEVQGSAARAGLQPGDIILAINNSAVKSVQDLRTLAGKLHSGEAAALLVERQGNQLFVPVRAS